ncbi:hypothetical protein L5515_008753 [Caenorhabditis briggsae]|uniref:EGF-like domain-containing protein n=1 Tax=Caenorhabditis briggsae TaxID=6238 RepID=A0AAE9JP47_CAEBR|nr:hypothetical protein L5515_008753 [Caenorhabditis briggsae]
MVTNLQSIVIASICLVSVFVAGENNEVTVPAVRVVRLQVDYRNASVSDLQKIHKWNAIMRNSVLASLKFINKHWLICGGSPSDSSTSSNADCGKAQVTGEIVGDRHYRINVTLIAERDPVKNAKVGATSTVYAVAHIGLKGGIFQYTNALKTLGKPEPKLAFDEAFFCYRGATLVDTDKCRLCTPGTFYDEFDEKCVPCPRGEFQDEHGRTICKTCPDSTTTVGAGTQKKEQCIHVCPPGYFYDTASKMCETCGLRGYQPNSGQDRCILCPEGTVPIYQNSTTIAHCLDKCRAGMQRSSDGSTCEPCPIGSFKSAEDMVCMMCPTGRTTLSKASKSLAACHIKICFPGTILDHSTFKCEPCDFGTFMDEYDGRICKTCPVSTTTYQLGANSAKMCEWTNQCKASTHNCHWLAACIDLPDENHKKMYSCKCKPGFAGNGFHCVDACEGFCLNGGSCLKTGRGETKCICANGFAGRRCQSEG